MILSHLFWHVVGSRWRNFSINSMAFKDDLSLCLSFWAKKFDPHALRNETTDATHLAEFHQVEFFVADYGTRWQTPPRSTVHPNLSLSSQKDQPQHIPEFLSVTHYITPYNFWNCRHGMLLLGVICYSAFALNVECVKWECCASSVAPVCLQVWLLATSSACWRPSSTTSASKRWIWHPYTTFI